MGKLAPMKLYRISYDKAYIPDASYTAPKFLHKYPHNVFTLLMSSPGLVLRLLRVYSGRVR